MTTKKYIPSPHPHEKDENPPKVKSDDVECSTCSRTVTIPECSQCSSEAENYCGNCEEKFCSDHIYDEDSHSCMDCDYSETNTCTECGTATGGECGQCEETLCEDCINTHMMDNHMDDVEDISEDDYKCDGCDETMDDCDCEPEKDDKDE